MYGTFSEKHHVVDWCKQNFKWFWRITYAYILISGFFILIFLVLSLQKVQLFPWNSIHLPPFSLNRLCHKTSLITPSIIIIVQSINDLNVFKSEVTSVNNIKNKIKNLNSIFQATILSRKETILICTHCCWLCVGLAFFSKLSFKTKLWYKILRIRPFNVANIVSYPASLRCLFPDSEYYASFKFSRLFK